MPYILLVVCKVGSGFMQNLRPKLICSMGMVISELTFLAILRLVLKMVPGHYSAKYSGYVYCWYICHAFLVFTLSHASGVYLS